MSFFYWITVNPWMTIFIQVMLWTAYLATLGAIIAIKRK